MRTSSLLLLVGIVIAQQKIKIPEVREWDYIITKHGRVLVGRIVDETPTKLIFSPRRNPALKYPIPRDSISEIYRSQDPEGAFRHRLKDAKTPEKMLEVTEWALKYPTIQDVLIKTLYKWCCQGQKEAEFYHILLFLLRQKAATEGRSLKKSEIDMLLDAFDAAKVSDPRFILAKASILMEAGFAPAVRRLLKGKKFQGRFEVRRLSLLGEASFRVGLMDKALGCAETILKTEPKNTKALALKVRSLLNLKKPEDALSTIKILKEKEPLWYKTFAFEGAALYLKGDLEGALNALNRACSLCKPDVDLICDVAQILILLGRVNTALAKLEEAKEQGLTWRLKYLEALCKRFLGKDDWHKLLEEASDMEGAPPFVLWQNAAALFEYAAYDEAESEARGALKAGFAPELCWELMARCRLAKGDTSSAYRFALYSLAANQHHYPALLIIYRVQAQSDPKRALRRLLEAHQIAPQNPQILRWLVYHFYTHNKLKRARTYLSSLEAVANDSYTKQLKDLLWRLENLVLWKDEFRREDSLDVGGGWLEEGEKQGGLEWEIVGGHLQAEDKAKRGGTAFLLREEGTLFRIEAKIDTSGLASGRAGLVFGTRGVKSPVRAWLAVYADSKGGVWWNTGSSWMRAQSQQKEPFQTTGGVLRFALECVDKITGVWRVFVNGKKVGELKGDKSLGGTKTYVAGLFINTVEDQGGKILVHWVKIYRRKKR